MLTFLDSSLSTALRGWVGFTQLQCPSVCLSACLIVCSIVRLSPWPCFLSAKIGHRAADTKAVPCFLLMKNSPPLKFMTRPRERQLLRWRNGRYQKCLMCFLRVKKLFRREIYGCDRAQSWRSKTRNTCFYNNKAYIYGDLINKSLLKITRNVCNH